MNEELPEIENKEALAIMYADIKIVLNALINRMEIYSELFDKDKPFESYVCGRTMSWIEIFKAYQKELNEKPE